MFHAYHARKKIFASLLCATLAAIAYSRPVAAANPQDYEKYTPTPPRLSYAEGEVSFWRPGAEEWSQAQVNTPLAAGDALYTGPGANLELEIGARAFIRAGEQTQIGIANLEPDFLQVEVKAGSASVDVRSIPAGHTVEIDTPNAAFTIENSGYYRVDVDEDTTTFTTRRGGRASITPAAGAALAVASSETVVVQGKDTPTVETYMAPDMDDWDRWNYTRTDRIIDSMSARYVSPDVYGTDDLDYYGRWRMVPTYGSVWVPSNVAPGWAPYSTGRWISDPYYGWTWIDDAPWGWAPYHYGRWVFVDGFWAWAPGPVVVSPVYSPALVAFFGGWDSGFHFGFSSGPGIGWVALGWGEPCYPWWGPGYFRYQPWWGGWGGPHRHWHDDDWDHDHHGHDHDHDHDGDHDHHDGDHDGHDHPWGRNRDDYDNTRHNGIVSVGQKGFGRGGLQPVRLSDRDLKQARPIEGALPVRADRKSMMPGAATSTRPPKGLADRPIVATRKPHDPTPALEPVGLTPKGRGFATPVKIVEPPKRGAVAHAALPRAPFGTRVGPERDEPPAPPPYRGNGSGNSSASARPEQSDRDSSSHGRAYQDNAPRGGGSGRSGIFGKPQQRATPPPPRQMRVAPPPAPTARARSFDTDTSDNHPSTSRSSSSNGNWPSYGGNRTPEAHGPSYGGSRTPEARGNATRSTRSAPEQDAYEPPRSEPRPDVSYGGGSQGSGSSQRSSQPRATEQRGGGHAQATQRGPSLPGQPANRVYGGRSGNAGGGGSSFGSSPGGGSSFGSSPGGGGGFGGHSGGFGAAPGGGGAPGR